MLSATILLLFSVIYRYTIASLDGLEVVADLLSNISVTADEIPGYLLIWVSFLGAYLAIRDDMHIKCDMFLEPLNHKWRLIIELFIEALVIAFFAMLFYLSILMIMIDGSTEIETAEIAQGYFYAYLSYLFDVNYPCYLDQNMWDCQKTIPRAVNIFTSEGQSAKDHEKELSSFSCD